MNTKDNWLTTAKVDNPERRAFWMSTLGTDTVPILSIIPEWATLPGIGSALVYLLDIHALSDEQQERLLAALAEKFQLSIDEEREAFYRDGVPILADDLEVTSTDPALIASILDDDVDDDEFPGDEIEWDRDSERWG